MKQYLRIRLFPQIKSDRLARSYSTRSSRKGTRVGPVMDSPVENKCKHSLARSLGSATGIKRPWKSSSMLHKTRPKPLLAAVLQSLQTRTSHHLPLHPLPHQVVQPLYLQAQVHKHRQHQPPLTHRHPQPSLVLSQTLKSTTITRRTLRRTLRLPRRLILLIGRLVLFAATIIAEITTNTQTTRCLSKFRRSANRLQKETSNRTANRCKFLTTFVSRRSRTLFKLMKLSRQTRRRTRLTMNRSGESSFQGTSGEWGRCSLRGEILAWSIWGQIAVVNGSVCNEHMCQKSFRMSADVYGNTYVSLRRGRNEDNPFSITGGMFAHKI